MIVPRSRMLFWVAVVVLPFTLLVAVAPNTAPVALLFIGGFLLVAIADAIGAGKNLAGVDIELPAVTRMSKDREARLELRIRNEHQRQRLCASA